MVFFQYLLTAYLTTSSIMVFREVENGARDREREREWKRKREIERARELRAK